MANAQIKGIRKNPLYELKYCISMGETAIGGWHFLKTSKILI